MCSFRWNVFNGFDIYRRHDLIGLLYSSDARVSKRLIYLTALLLFTHLGYFSFSKKKTISNIDGNPDYSLNDPNQVNFKKMTQIWNTVQQLISFQQSKYQFKVNQKIRDFILSVEPNKNEEEQYARSLFLEPRTDDFY